MMSPQARYVSPDRDKKLPNLSSGDPAGARLSGEVGLEHVAGNGKLMHCDVVTNGRLVQGTPNPGKQGKDLKQPWASSGNSPLASLLSTAQPGDESMHAHPVSMFESASMSPYSNALPATKARGVYCTRAAVVAAATQYSQPNVVYRSSPTTTTCKKPGTVPTKHRNVGSLNALLREVKPSNSPMLSSLPLSTNVVIGAQVNTAKEHVPHKLFMSQQLGPRSSTLAAAHRDVATANQVTARHSHAAGLEDSRLLGGPTARSISGRFTQGGSHDGGEKDLSHLHITLSATGDAAGTATSHGPPSPSLPQLGNNNLVHHGLVVAYPSSTHVGGHQPGPPSSHAPISKELQAAVALAQSKTKPAAAWKAPTKNSTPKLPNALMYNNSQTSHYETATPKAYYPRASEATLGLSQPLEKGGNPVLRAPNTAAAAMQGSFPTDLYIPPYTAAVTLTIGSGGKLETVAAPKLPTMFNIFDKSTIISMLQPSEQVGADLEAPATANGHTPGVGEASPPPLGSYPASDPSTLLTGATAASSTLPGVAVSPSSGTVDHFPTGTSFNTPRYQIFTPQMNASRGAGTHSLGRELKSVIDGVRTDLSPNLANPHQVMSIPKSKFVNQDKFGPLRMLRPQDLLPKLVAEKNDPRPVTPCLAHLDLKEKRSGDISKDQMQGTAHAVALPPVADAKHDPKLVPLPQVAMAASLASKRATPMAVRTPMYARRGIPLPAHILQQQKQQQQQQLAEQKANQALPPAKPSGGAAAAPGLPSPPSPGGASRAPAQSPMAQASVATLAADPTESLLPSNVVLDLIDVLGSKPASASKDTSSSAQAGSDQTSGRPAAVTDANDLLMGDELDLCQDVKVGEPHPLRHPHQRVSEVGMELDTMLESILGSLPERIATPASRSSSRSAAPSQLGSRPPTQQGAGAGALGAPSAVGGATMPLQRRGLIAMPTTGDTDTHAAAPAVAAAADPSLAEEFANLPVQMHPASAPVILRHCVERSLSALGDALGAHSHMDGMDMKEDAHGTNASKAVIEDTDDSDLDDTEYVDLEDSDVDAMNSSTGLLSVSAYGISHMQHLEEGSSLKQESNEANDTIVNGVRILGQKYEVQHMVGEGAYGMVTKCKVIGSDRYVAIKEFKIEDDDPDADDVKRTSKREVKLLHSLRHANVVELVDEFFVRDHLFIVMEFVPCNLLELLEAQPGGMDREAVRLIMYQLCTAMAFIHGKNVVFRDIKPENILVDEHGRLKLCDFGFARFMNGPGESLTDYVATRWYRAPELLLGPPFRRPGDMDGDYVQSMYGPPVDMWAIGCVLGELMDGDPLFAGDSDLDQLYKVQQMLGPMCTEHLAMFNENPHNTGIVFNIKHPSTLASRYAGKMNEVEIDFMAGLLHMDPKQRFTAEMCLHHPYLADLLATDSPPKYSYTSSIDGSSMPSSAVTSADATPLPSLNTTPLPPSLPVSSRSKASANGRPVFNSSGRASRNSQGIGSAKAASITQEPGPKQSDATESHGGDKATD